MFYQCFDNVAMAFMEMQEHESGNIIVCHGIVEAQKPGSKGRTGHAWIERDAAQADVRLAIDPTAKITMDAKQYRKSLNPANLHEYTAKEFLYNWWLHKIPGPWEPEIKAVTRNSETGSQPAEKK